MRRQNWHFTNCSSTSINGRELTEANIGTIPTVTLQGLTGATPNNVDNEFLTVDSAGNYSYRQQLAATLEQVTPGVSSGNDEATNNAAVVAWVGAISGRSFKQWQIYRNESGQVFIYTGSDVSNP